MRVAMYFHHLYIEQDMKILTFIAVSTSISIYCNEHGTESYNSTFSWDSSTS